MSGRLRWWWKTSRYSKWFRKVAIWVCRITGYVCRSVGVISTLHTPSCISFFQLLDIIYSTAFPRRRFTSLFYSGRWMVGGCAGSIVKWIQDKNMRHVCYCVRVGEGRNISLCILSLYIGSWMCFLVLSRAVYRLSKVMVRSATSSCHCIPQCS